MDVMTVQGTDLQIKEYQGKRVVTFKDIDAVHQRKSGTASRNFNQNRERFIEGVDFYIVPLADNEIRRAFGVGHTQSVVTVITETGYLMLVKSFTDDLAWEVQRQLVDSYFRARIETDKDSIQQVINSGVPTVIVTTDNLIKCAEIMAGCLDGNRSYVLNILRNVVPNIDTEEEVPGPAEVVEVSKPKAQRPCAAYLPKVVPIDTTKMLLEMSIQGMDLPTLSRKSNVNMTTIMSWIKGKHEPLEQSRRNVCAALGKDENFLTPKRKRNVKE